ncbi:hypothetical protein BV22DRAFT_1133958 [Leucogyrophana mollusca]|uniref:Uncharacterized protein n=1 Tax=Leucogyrophana mollusca TaxID=85980 RepID=A0ACB8B1J1_9AGAM|nr:hypothetical protein BV22DRAFT_1133958 [Leucogyrophana mollusca]
MSTPSISAKLLMRGPLMGTLFGMLLYGVTCMQAFYYFQHYRNDRRAVKATVAVIWLLESAHACLAVNAMDFYLIANFGSEETLLAPTWEIMSVFVLGLLINYVVYLVFTWRIWQYAFTVSRRSTLSISMISIATTRTALGIASSFTPTRGLPFVSALKQVQSHLQPSSALMLPQVYLIIALVMFIVGDSLSALAMAYYLNKSRSGLRRMDNLIDQLVLYCVGTGALTSIIYVASLITDILEPNSLTFMGIILVQTRLYSNSLLTSLNMRTFNAEKLNNDTFINVSQLSIQFSTPQSSDVNRTSRFQTNFGLTRLETGKGSQLTNTVRSPISSSRQLDDSTPSDGP